jgi:hypothetical protein
MIHEIPPKGSRLATLELHRHADGSIHMSVIDMDPRLIETTGEEVPERLKIIADWAVEGAVNMSEMFDA